MCIRDRQYTGETDTKAKGINSAFVGAFDNLDEDTKQSFIDAMEGAETGLSEKDVYKRQDYTGH